MSSRRGTVHRAAVLLALSSLLATAVMTTGVRAAPTRTAPTAEAALAAYVAPTTAPFDGQPISHGLGPTYGETWCAPPAPGTSIANQQGAPLALVPYESFGCLLEQFQDEAAAADIPPRLTFEKIGQTDAGRDQWGAVVNALETEEQQEAYANWQAYRAIALTDPEAAQDLLESYGDNVKIPIFVENNIHGDEEEGADSMMQIIRDLVTTPRGVHPTVDNFLDHAILITIPNMNPDGRFNGTRANGNGFDMNRDWLVQSQPEVRNNIALQVEWLAPVMLATHGYVNPTLIDGLTKPHNPGLEYDIFLYWNQRRLDANQDALARIGQGITRPVNGPLSTTVDKWNYITAATAPATTATITTQSPHGLTAGGTVTVSGVGVAGYDGTITILTTPTTSTFTYAVAGPLANSSGGTAGSAPFTTLARGGCSNGNVPAAATNVCGTGTIAAAPGGLTQSGTTVTVTTTAVIAAAPVKVADTVVIAGAGVAGYNGGPFKVTSVLSPTQFTIENPTTGLAASGGGSVQVQTGPNQAEGWDDLGPFYTQTYSAFFGVDGSTLEMCSTCTAPFTGRLGSKTAQYVGFYSSADFWIENREAMLADQVEMFVRGVQDAPRPACCDDPLVVERGFTEAEHDWMTDYPDAFVIPVGDEHQRSDAEAQRMAQWILDNGITLEQATADFTWNGQTYAAGSYVVPMDQPMRGLAFTALAAGIDYSQRISQLYAPPGAWSHGLMWGADTIEIPNGDSSFSPSTVVVTETSELAGGVAGGESDWYSVSVKGVRELQAIYDLLRAGHYGEIAEAPFVSTSGGAMPAGTLIFPNDPATVAALEAAGEAAGVTFERNVGVTKPATKLLSEAPTVGIVANPNASGVFSNTDVSTSLKRIFGDDAQFVSLVTGPNSVQNAATDPLLDIDVLYNTGQAYPAVANATARTRLNDFFARGGGYLTPNVAASLNFLTQSDPVLVRAGAAIAASPGGATSGGTTTATITTTTPHGLVAGQQVVVAGVGVAAYNGTVVVASVPTATSFTYAIAAAAANSGGGTVNGFVAANSAAFGGTGVWDNVGGASSPLTGAFPTSDFFYLPSNVTYFSSVPATAVVDGRYPTNMVDADVNGPSAGWIAGLWRNRTSAASVLTNSAPVIVHGETAANSRYFAIGTNPFSRSDFERTWGLIGQATLWSDLTDETVLDQTITFDPVDTTQTYGDDAFAITASSTSGRSVYVAAVGDCTLDSPTAPATATITGAGSCTITASQPGNANYAPATDVQQVVTIDPAELTVAPDPTAPTSQYSDALQTITAVIEGYVDDDDASDLTTVPTCTTTATPTSAPTTYPITCAGGVSDDYTFTYDDTRLYTITVEDAAATSTSDTVAFTAPNANSVSVTLQATIRDSSLIASFADAAAGDIRNATVTFKEGSTVLCANVPVQLVGAPLTTGSATCTATLALGTHPITITVGGFYAASASSSVLVLRPDGSWLGGEGAAPAGSSAGTYAAAPGSNVSLAIDVRWLKNLKGMDGSATVRFQRAGRTYEIRGTTTRTLGMTKRTSTGAACTASPSATCWAIGEYRATASLRDVTGGQTLATNLSVRITMTDKGSPGKNDSIGVTLSDPAGILLFSSDWSGAATRESALGTGNIVAH